MLKDNNYQAKKSLSAYNDRGEQKLLRERTKKMATFFNQATISYGDNVTNSNVTEGELLNGLTLTKTALTTAYGKDEGIIYAVTVTNDGTAALSGLTLTDNLGLYTTTPGGIEVVPLTYTPNSLTYYVDGVSATAPTVTAGPPLTVSGISIAAGSTVTLIYEARANAYAPLATGSVIDNTATLTGNSPSLPLSDNASVPVRSEVSLTIAKAICPEVVRDDGELTYTFVIQNTGNTAVIATDDVIVTDSFNPILNPITVTLNGVTLTEGTDYEYDETTGQFRTLPGAITVPAATYTQDALTGLVTLTPGISTLQVKGTV